MQPLPERSDQDLWRAAVAGEPAAWGDLFLRHHRAVHAFCFRWTGSPSMVHAMVGGHLYIAWWPQTKAVVTKTTAYAADGSVLEIDQKTPAALTSGAPMPW